MDEDFTEDELDEIIAEIDTDKSDTIDFNEFVKIMTWHLKIFMWIWNVCDTSTISPSSQLYLQN